MRKAILLGAGGQSRVVISILADLGLNAIAGVIDINESGLAPKKNESIMGIPVFSRDVLTNFSDLKNDLDVFLAIGDCQIRREWFNRMLDMGFFMPNLLSPGAIIHSSAKLGFGNVVCSGVFIGPEALLGDNNLINTSSILEHESSVSSHCHVAPRALICGRSVVANSCFVGAGVTIIDGIRVADYTTLGAGAILVKDINEPHGVYLGVPARRMVERSA